MPAVAGNQSPTVDDALAAIAALDDRISRFSLFLDGLDELARVSLELGVDEKPKMRPPMGAPAAFFVGGLTQEWKELRAAFTEALNVGHFRQKGRQEGGD